MAKRRVARRRKRVGAQSIGLAPADTAEVQGAGMRELADRIKQDGGAVLGSYREPFGGTPAVLATLPIDRVEPTPYQRDLLMSAGRYDEAANQCARMPAENGLRIQCLGRARFGQGRADEAIALFRADPEMLQNPQTRGFFGFGLAPSGHRDEAARMAAAATRANEAALIYAGLGDKDRTLAALEEMSARGAQRIGSFLNSPEMDLLRGDPRVQALRRKVGLPD